ncbi:MAG: Uma2 family endonuclease [Acidobacteria bacterium]|nr:Uma2 family endonuclease [Acidobacteriota bacterium]
MENPVLLVEVLSKGTAAYDRGAKFAHCQHIESLREYVLVWQTRQRIDVRPRGDDGSKTSVCRAPPRGSLI